MIKKLDITNPAIRAQVIALQRRSYLTWAKLTKSFMAIGWTKNSWGFYHSK